MIKHFEFYLKKRLVKKKVPNRGLAASLIEKSKLRLKRLRKIKINDEESSIVFEEIYECLREAAQSLLELAGFTPYYHEVIISFLKEKKSLPEIAINRLNNYRILRNNSVYKAEKVSLNKCKEALIFAKKTIPELEKLFKIFIQ